jgi:hypothetical protein
MTKPALLSAAVITAAMLATPAMARHHHVASRHHAANAAAAPGLRYIDGRPCYPAPRVAAFATAPWEHDTPCEPVLAY